MKKALLALAVSLAAVSGAHAAWDNGSVDGFGGNGELLLAVWDTNTGHKVGVAQDLGDHFFDYDAILADPTFSKTYALDTNAFSVFATSKVSDLRYAVVAISDGQLNTTTQQAMVTTKLANPVANSIAVGNMINASVSTAGKINVTDQDYTANNAVKMGAGQVNTAYLGDSGTFGQTFTANSVPFNITGSIGDKLNFFELNGVDPLGNETPNVKAVGQFSINLTNNTLTYAAPAPAVPVPAAAWLMGSALLGLGSIARRRSV